MSNPRFAPVSVRSQAGFSLLQILVAFALISILVLQISNMMLNANRQVRSVESKGDFSSLVNTLQSEFNNADGCMAALGSNLTLKSNLASSKPQDITLNLGSTALQAGSNYGALKISKLQFTDKSAGGAANQWIVPLLLQIDRSQGGQTAIGGNLLEHTFQLVVTVDNGVPDPKIIKCAGQYQNLWGTKGNDIYYTQGKVGIQMDTPTYTLDVGGGTGGVGGTVRAGTYLYNSDARLKKNIRPIAGALERVLQLRGVKYRLRHPSDAFAQGDQLGLIAQEVERTFPEVVATDPETGMKSVAYANLVSPLIEALKEQQALIQAQQREIEEIKRALAQASGK